MPRRAVLPMIVAVLCLIAARRSEAAEDVGPFVRAFWLVQSHGTPELVNPRNDQKLKGRLVKALGLDPKIYEGSTFEALKYAECRDDIGRLMLSVMMRVRNALNQR